MKIDFNTRKLSERHVLVHAFLSLLISLFVASLGDVANLAIANNISFAAIGVMGAYYTISWFTGELIQFGLYAYRVDRRDEWAYIKIATSFGIVIGLIVTLFSGVIPHAFGIDAEQKMMLSSMLILAAIHLPTKAMGQGVWEALRLRGELRGFRRSLFSFYFVSIPANLIMFALVREVWCVVIATVLGNLVIIAVGAWYLRKLPFTKVTRRHIDCVIRYGAPLVGERMIQRVGLTIYGICASYLPAEMYAVHSICLQAVYSGDVGDAAYSAALLVLVPDKTKKEDSKERYISERERMIAYRRKTAWVAILFSFIPSYIFAFISHAEADLALVMWFTFFYAFSFVPMAISTPGKDFLTIQKKPLQVMISTLCGVPAYIVIPLVAIFVVAPVDSIVALYFFGLTGTAQILICAVLYMIFIKRMDKNVGVDIEEIRKNAKHVVLEDTSAVSDVDDNAIDSTMLDTKTKDASDTV